jgi:hypothetical protein
MIMSKRLSYSMRDLVLRAFILFRLRTRFLRFGTLLMLLIKDSITLSVNRF